MNYFRKGNRIYIQGGVNDSAMYWIETMERKSRIAKMEEIVDWSRERFNPLYIVETRQG